MTGPKKRKITDATAGDGSAAHTAAPPSAKRHHQGATDTVRRDDAYYRDLYTSEVNFPELGKKDTAFGTLYVTLSTESRS